MTRFFPASVFDLCFIRGSVPLFLVICGINLAPAQEPQRVAKFRDFIQHLSWSPDGTKFLFTRVPPGKMGLWTMNTDGSDQKALMPKEPMPHFDGHWSPDGKRIVFVFDQLQGTDGKLQIDVIDADGMNRKTLLPHKAFDEAPRWSPDGKQIAWVSTRDKNQDIWICDSEGKNLKRLTSDPGPDNSPAWSPDGKQIAFSSGRSGNFEIFVMNADGSDQRNLSNHPKMDYWPAWSPDGKRIAFTSNRDGQYEIYVMNADGSSPRNVSNHPAVDNFATWAPDSRRLAFVTNRAGTYDVTVVDLK
jgi:TolB protein